MKKLGLILLIGFLGCALFAGGQQDSGASESTEKTLSVWNFKYSEEAAGAAFRAMDALYMEKNPDVTIDHVAQPHDNYYEILGAALSAQAGPDVALVHADQRIWNLSAGLTSLDSYVASWKDEVPDITWAACSEINDPDEQIKIIPLTSQGIGMYYNKLNFEKAGLDPDDPPADWNDFLAACEALKEAGIPPVILGNQGSPFGIDFLYRVLLANFYGPELTGLRDGSTTLDGPGFAQATRMIKELYEREYVNVDNGSIPYFMEAIERFKQGQGGFFVGLTSDIAHWKDFGDAVGFENIGYFPSINHPSADYRNRQANQGAGIGFAVTAFSQEQELAADYLYEYVHGESAQLWVERMGAILPSADFSDAEGLLKDVVTYMNRNAVPDYYNQLEPGFASDFYNYQQLLFVADGVSLDEYLQKLRAQFKASIE